MIKAADFCKRFEEYDAVKGLNLEIQEGCIYGLVGTNGSGKSTFMRSISGVYAPTWGNITIDDQPVFENPEAKRKVFFVSDDMFFTMNTIDQVAKFYKGLYPTWSDEKYLSLMSKFPLDKNKKIKTFSKGMKRQAALIIALSCQPKYLLLDEAFDGLDPVIRVAVRKLVADQVSENGLTVIIASHNLRELEDLCDTIGILHHGQLILEQSTQTLSQSFCKIQAAFKPMISRSELTGDEILSINIQGSVAQIITRCSRQEIEPKIQALNPVLVEFMPLSLEEVFVYEMEAAGYDYNNVIF